MGESVHCDECGEVIGIYEPLVTLVHGRPHETSRAAGSNPASDGAACYHRACFGRRRHGAEISPSGAAEEPPQ